MSGVSGPELVLAACRAGIIGSFPAHNASSHHELNAWLSQIEDGLASYSDTHPGAPVGPIALNLVMRLKSRLERDITAVVEHRVPIVIASVGSPASIIPGLHAEGVSVLADVASMRHVDKALEAGADGLVLLTGGAGGNTGWLNPFAFARAVRAFYGGPLVLAGGVCDGFALRAARQLGFDLAFMGTRFIATTESRASDEYKQAVLGATLDDIEARASTEARVNYIRDSDWSAGHTVSAVREVLPVAALVEQIRREYDTANHT